MSSRIRARLLDISLLEEACLQPFTLPGLPVLRTNMMLPPQLHPKLIPLLLVSLPRASCSSGSHYVAIPYVLVTFEGDIGLSKTVHSNGTIGTGLPFP